MHPRSELISWKIFRQDLAGSFPKTVHNVKKIILRQVSRAHNTGVAILRLCFELAQIVESLSWLQQY